MKYHVRIATPQDSFKVEKAAKNAAAANKKAANANKKAANANKNVANILLKMSRKKRG